jgi:NAD(P)-dependent dehydrogenase (short-subunit alcohol dehydrogenase family)
VSSYVVTGSAFGIGAALTARLREDGHRVIGVDRAVADVRVDLSTETGRSAAVSEIQRLAPDGIAGLVPCAGIGGFTGVDSRLVVSVNYFGAVRLAEELRPLLARGAKLVGAGVVVISSNSITCQPGWAEQAVGPCLEYDEPRARQVAAPWTPYMCIRRRRRPSPHGRGGRECERSGSGPGSVSTRWRPAWSRPR